MVRGNLAYEFRHAARPNGIPEAAHYRMTAVRTPSGENVAFTYGLNGVDFEAACAGTSVRVALDGSLPAPGSKTFRDMEARLQVTYEGPRAVAGGYTVGILPRADSRSLLHVAWVQADGSGETVGFTYGKAPAVSLAGSAGNEPDAPTVLQEITFPARSIRLEWEPQPGSYEVQRGDGRRPESSLSFGVGAVYEEGAALEPSPTPKTSPRAPFGMIPKSMR